MNKRKKRNPNYDRIAVALGKLGSVRECEPAETEADFEVTPPEGKAFGVQVWSAMEFAEVNRSRDNIHIAFCVGAKIYCYPHNKMLEAVFGRGKIHDSPSWQQLGRYFITPRYCRDGWQRDLLVKIAHEL